MSNDPITIIDRKIENTKSMLSSLPEEDQQIPDLARKSMMKRLDELEQEKLVLIKSQKKDIVKIVFTGKHVKEGKVSLRLLTDILSQFQVLANSIAYTLTQEPSNKGRIPEAISNQSEFYFTKCFEGSFGVELECYHDEQNSLVDPLITSTINRFYGLLYASCDPEMILEEAGYLGYRAVNNYKKLLELIDRQEVDMSWNWFNNNLGSSKWKIKHKELSPIIATLKNIKEERIDNMVVKGKITGLNSRKGTFEAVTETEDVISGKAVYDIILNAGKAMESYRNLHLRKTVLTNPALSKEKISWHLNSVTEL